MMPTRSAGGRVVVSVMVLKWEEEEEGKTKMGFVCADSSKGLQDRDVTSARKDRRSDATSKLDEDTISHIK